MEESYFSTTQYLKTNRPIIDSVKKSLGISFSFEEKESLGFIPSCNIRQQKIIIPYRAPLYNLIYSVISENNDGTCIVEDMEMLELAFNRNDAKQLEQIGERYINDLRDFNEKYELFMYDEKYHNQYIFLLIHEAMHIFIKQNPNIFQEKVDSNGLREMYHQWYNGYMHGYQKTNWMDHLFGLKTYNESDRAFRVLMEEICCDVNAYEAMLSSGRFNSVEHGLIFAFALRNAYIKQRIQSYIYSNWDELDVSLHISPEHSCRFMTLLNLIIEGNEDLKFEYLKELTVIPSAFRVSTSFTNNVRQYDGEVLANNRFKVREIMNQIIEEEEEILIWS